MSASPFAIYEEVRIHTSNQELEEIHGERGVILGMTESDGIWSYAVLLESTNTCWCIEASALLSKGLVRKREEFYSDVSLRVSQHGRLID